MSNSTPIPASDRQLALERFREYLRLLAGMNIGAQLRKKIDPSDIVQQALLEAHRKQANFRGQTDAELAAWLRQILAYSLSDALKHMGRAKRDTDREMSLQASVDASSMQLQGLLAADQSSPSQRAQNHEQILELAEALAQIPESQREAVLLRHCQGWSLEAIAQHVGRTERAVSGLLQRGLAQLRDIMDQRKA